MKEYLGLAAALIAFAQCIPYIWDILYGKTRPHLFTYVVWSITALLIFFGQLSAGGGPGAWATGVMAVLALFIMSLCFKYGTEDVTWFDALFFVGALVAITPWFFMKDPSVSIILATVVSLCAFVPTLRKTIKDPSSEPFHGWWPNLFRYPMAIMALETYNVATLFHPLAVFSMNVVLVYIIVKQRIKW